MSEFKSALKPYDLEAALATDRGDDCLVLDVGYDENGEPVASLGHVVDQVEHYVAHVDDPIFSATKLYIVGAWNLTPTELKDETDTEANDIEASDA
jgi:hypothetical protein